MNLKQVGLAVMSVLTGIAITSCHSSKCIAEKDTPAPSRPSLMAEWQAFTNMPILNYSWQRNKNDEERQKRFRDYLTMGITGIYNADHDPSYGGKLFQEKGLHGYLPQAKFTNAREPVLDPDGKPATFRRRRHLWHSSIFSKKNVNKYFNYLVDKIVKYNIDYMFHVNDTVAISSWDETGLYGREAIEYGYDSKERFIKYLKDVIFNDDTPEGKPGSDWTFNKATGLNLKSWNDVEPPRLEERYKNPGLWRLWIGFHGYYTNKFFLNMGEKLSKKLDNDIEIFPFQHATVKWPGASSTKGLDWYWQARMHRILTVEDCQADFPGSNLSYYFTDQLSRRYQRPVIGWSWFWPEANRSNDPKEAGRALARIMGHNVHGVLFWVYTSQWAEKPKMRTAVAYWHKLLNAHWSFLKNSWVPKPQVALVFPRNTGNMYPKWDYPKIDYGWMVQALTEAHIPFEIIADNQVEIEPSILKNYKALLIPTATWESQKFRNEVKEFINNGGYVLTTGDSFQKDVETGKKTAFLKEVFAIDPDKKYKGIFSPTYDNLAEYEWKEKYAKNWQTPKWDRSVSSQDTSKTFNACTPLKMDDTQYRELMKSLPTQSGTGLKQTLLNPITKHIINGKNSLPATHQTFHDIVTGKVGQNGQIVATYKNEPCAVETEQTLWVGFRPGFDHACVFPLTEMRKWGEPVWPFDKTISKDAAERNTSRQWITRILDKADITSTFKITRNNKPTPHIEVHHKQDSNANSLVVLINHNDISGNYQVQSPVISDAECIIDLMSGKTLKTDSKGVVTVQIPSEEVVLLVAGSKEFCKERLKAHQSVSKDIPEMVVIK